ncbi:hypothetical protein FOZ60_015068 [Perkinsus olseni]|uniref:Uncharacterized protein n=1 Tax=Perkinsus olseni TaxID=32597 RepID=A0A7J6N673_PEROL|nr:hypothetical protein FOZ60_015068 [Perkinsus olseni]
MPPRVAKESVIPSSTERALSHPRAVQSNDNDMATTTPIFVTVKIDDGADACYTDSTLLEDLRQRGVRYEERPTRGTCRTVFGNDEVQQHITAVLQRFSLCPDDGQIDVDSSSQVTEFIL